MPSARPLMASVILFKAVLIVLSLVFIIATVLPFIRSDEW